MTEKYYKYNWVGKVIYRKLGKRLKFAVQIVYTQKRIWSRKLDP